MFYPQNTTDQNNRNRNKKAVAPASTRSKSAVKEIKQEQRAQSAASNVVLPSQYFEEEINNLAYTEADERVMDVGSREVNQPKKSERLGD